jgi:L-iditol 2-dehydrogenase
VGIRWRIVRVARLHGVGDIRLGEEPTPVAGAGTSLVRVTAVGICGSDLHWYAEAGIGDAQLKAPLVVGHEFAGVIEGGPRHGQRVAVDPAVPCGVCESCLEGNRNLCPYVQFAGHSTTDGALREFVAWPTQLLHPLPDTLSDADGAMLEPLGVALHAVDLGHLRPGATVAVIGCGPIGLCVIQLARAAGATTIVAADPLAHRREAARRYGADVVLTADPVLFAAGLSEATANRGVDVGFEVAGTDAAVGLTIAAVRPGAKVVLIGIPDDDATTFSASAARRKGISLIMVRRMNDVYPRAIRLVERHRVDVSSLVTDRFALSRVAQAFRTAQVRAGLKVIVEADTPDDVLGVWGDVLGAQVPTPPATPADPPG